MNTVRVPVSVVVQTLVPRIPVGVYPRPGLNMTSNQGHQRRHLPIWDGPHIQESLGPTPAAEYLKLDTMVGYLKCWYHGVCFGDVPATVVLRPRRKPRFIDLYKWAQLVRRHSDYFT